MLSWLKKYIALIHTGGQDVKLLQDGKHYISLIMKKLLLCILVGVPTFSVVAISSLPLSTL
jgi:hypothetical protein